MLTEFDVARALETLGAIPGFPRESGARAVIGRLLGRYFPDAEKLTRSVDAAVATMGRWTGMPGLLGAEAEQSAAAPMPTWDGQKPKCQRCHGSGYLIIATLLTFSGPNSYQVIKTEKLTEYSPQQIEDFCAKLGPEQTVATAADVCPCKLPGGRIVVPGEPFCRRCQDFGYYGGKLAGEFAGEWKWCDCAAGRERQSSESGLVDEANAARAKLLAIPSHDKARRGYRDVAGLL